MFVTYEYGLGGQFRAPDGHRMLWRSVDVGQCDYYFLIEGMGLEDGCLGPVAHLVEDVRTLEMVRRAELGNFISVSRIHLITPPSKNNRSCYAMELLAEIRVRESPEAGPFYEFITEAGQIYTSSRYEASTASGGHKLHERSAL